MGTANRFTDPTHGAASADVVASDDPEVMTQVEGRKVADASIELVELRTKLAKAEQERDDALAELGKRREGEDGAKARK